MFLWSDVFKNPKIKFPLLYQTKILASFRKLEKILIYRRPGPYALEIVWLRFLCLWNFNVKWSGDLTKFLISVVVKLKYVKHYVTSTIQSSIISPWRLKHFSNKTWRIDPLKFNSQQLCLWKSLTIYKGSSCSSHH